MAKVSKRGESLTICEADVTQDLDRLVHAPLTSEDRAVIASGLRQRLTYQQIGDLVGRTRSVIWREVARNSGPDGRTGRRWRIVSPTSTGAGRVDTTPARTAQSAEFVAS